MLTLPKDLLRAQGKATALSLRQRIKRVRQQLHRTAAGGGFSELKDIEEQQGRTTDHGLGPATMLGVPRKLHAVICRWRKPKAIRYVASRLQ